MLVFSLLCLLAVVSLTADAVPLAARITNGQEAVAGGTPNIVWQAGLLINGNRRCGGSILSDRYVLTAAHCVRDRSSDGVDANDVTYNPKSISICLGTNLNSCTTSALGDTMWVSTNYRASTLNANQVDLAVIQTREPISFGNNIGAIALGTFASCPSCTNPTQLQIVSGFGNQNADSQGSSNPSATLRFVNQQIVSRATCTAQAGSIPLGDICAGPISGESGTDSCQGDSGGAIAHQNGGVWYQTGVVSTGTVGKSANGPAICGGQGEYGVYAGVASNEGFINLALANDTSYPGYFTTGRGNAVSDSNSSLIIIIAAAVGGTLLLVLLIILICCCCRSSRHTRAQQNIRKQEHLQTSPRVAKSPRGGNNDYPPVSPRGTPQPHASHLPPVRPQNNSPQSQINSPPQNYGSPVAANPAYGVPLQPYDPASQRAPLPAVYTPQNVVYTPQSSGPPPAQNYGQF